MKHCPACNRTFSDNTLSFCLDDGIPLIANYQSSQFFDSKAETLLAPSSNYQIPSEKSVQAYQQVQTGQAIASVPSSAKQNDWINYRLATKLYLPPIRKTLVERPRLLEQLNEGLKGRLTIISAPAGFGKTSLVTAWREQSELPLAWFSLDDEDNEPTRFADYLIGALQTVDERLGQESSNLLQISPAPPLKVFLSSLINEISEQTIEFVLAFEDYHVIHEPEIHEGVSFLIERLPSHVHTLITTRSDPPFPLSRLRARGELKELRAEDLRFGEAESTEFLNDVMQLQLSNQDITALGERTEGWITGLQLSALSLKGKENKSDFVKEFAGDDRFILDYLLEEVLHLQPDKVQNFLLQTSVLTRFNSSLCDALTQNNDGHETLEYLNRSNLFLIPLDNKNTWFRYHHLFSDLLRLKLKQKQTDSVRELQTKASLWCEQNDLIEEAINYALATQDWERALNLIEPIGYKLLSFGKFERLKHWIEAIPETALRTHPMLCYWYVPPLLYKDELEKAEKYLQIIETAEPEELRLTLIAEVWTSRALIAVVCGDLEKAEEFSRKAFDSLPPDDAIQHAAAVHIKVLCARLKGDMKVIEKVLYEALPIYQQAQHFLFEAWAKTYLGSIRAMQGHLREGGEILQNIIRYGKEHIPNRPEPMIYPNSALCNIYREWNDLETAKTYLNEALAFINQTGRESYMVLVPDSLKNLTLMLEMYNERRRSDELIKSALERSNRYGNKIVAGQINALNALIHFKRGENSFVNRWAESCGLSPDDKPTYQTELAHTTYARWLLATDKAKQALPLLLNLQKSAEEGSRQRIVIEVLILQAIAHKACGDENKALETLEKALNFGLSENFVRSFTDEGEEINLLLQTILKQKGKTWENESPKMLNYVISLVKSFGNTTIQTPIPEVSTQAEDLPWWYRNDPLSEREIEVLSLVAQGLSNQQIGDKLFIAAGTVKRHINNIYSKLDVHSRVQAIELVRKFGLIKPTN